MVEPLATTCVGHILHAFPRNEAHKLYSGGRDGGFRMGATKSTMVHEIIT